MRTHRFFRYLGSLVFFAIQLIAVSFPADARQRSEEGGGESELVARLRASGPISNLYDEGFVPVPGINNTYFLPNSNIVVRCGDKFTLNASLKRTFHCTHIDGTGRVIPGTDFVVQINPWVGDEGFSPYREPE